MTAALGDTPASVGHLGPCNARREWSRFYHIRAFNGLEALHARFVDHRYARHTHDYFVVALVEKGAASYWYRRAQCVASAGQVFVINPGEAHTGDPAIPGGYVYRVLYPRLEHFVRLAADIGIAGRELFFRDSVLSDGHLAALLYSVHRGVADGASPARCELLLLKAFKRLLTHHSAMGGTTRPVGRERPAVKAACEYIRAHFAEGVSLSGLSALVSLSPYYFARTFEKETGLPPHAYLEMVRIRKARELLDQGCTATSAAVSVGYADQSHLTHRFKRFLGITPGQYVRESKIQQGQS